MPLRRIDHIRFTPLPLVAHSFRSRDDRRKRLLPLLNTARLTTTTQLFQHLVFLPLVVRALFGEKLKPLRAEIGPHVACSGAFFLAACRHGGLN
jgi:hypothetical protein